MRLMYQLWYRFSEPPWTSGPRQDLVRLVEEDQVSPGRAIDLGCGSGDDSIFLAPQGFDLVGVDFVSSAIEKARWKAVDAGFDAEFVVDDVTKLEHVDGKFNLLVDYGTMEDLSQKARAAYMEAVLPLWVSCRPTTGSGWPASRPAASSASRRSDMAGWGSRIVPCRAMLSRAHSGLQARRRPVPASLWAAPGRRNPPEGPSPPGIGANPAARLCPPARVDRRAGEGLARRCRALPRRLSFSSGNRSRSLRRRSLAHRRTALPRATGLL